MLDVHAGSAKRRSPRAGATLDRPRAIRVSSAPSRPASRATVVPWLRAEAKPLAACRSDGIPSASPPPTDSAAPAAVIVASGLLTLPLLGIRSVIPGPARSRVSEERELYPSQDIDIKKYCRY